MGITKGRHVGIELLRILSMTFVINLHFILKGHYHESANAVVNFESWLLICLSVVAVNCYVLISGYFMSEKSFKLTRVTQTYSQVIFYSITTYIAVVLLGIRAFSNGDLFRAITPFTHDNYWFATDYLLLLLFTPLLNTAIKYLSKAKFELILFVLVGTYSLFNNILKPINPFDKTAGFGTVWFIILYLTSAYIKKHYTPNGKPLKYFAFYLITVLINITYHSIFGHLGRVLGQSMVREYNNILVYIGAVFLFLGFLNLKIDRKAISKIVLFFSPLTFGVYLIHESPFVSEWLWKIINENTWCISNPLFIFMALGTVVSIFLIASIIEFLRNKTFNVLKINYLINRVSNNVESKLRMLVVSRGKK